MDADFEAWTQDYLNGTLDRAGRERLAERLKKDPRALAAFADQLQLHQRLRVLESRTDPVTAAVLHEIEFQADSPRFSRDVVDAVKRLPTPFQRGRRSWLLWGAVASFLLVVGLVLVVPGEPPLGGPYVAAATSRVLLERQGKPLQLGRGMSVLPGDAVEVPPGGFLALRLPQAVRVELGPGRAGVVKLQERHRIELHRGALGASGPDLSIATPHGTLEGAASWVSVDVAAASTRVELEDGALVLVRRSDGARLELSRGQAARLEEGAPLAAAPLRRTALFVVGEGALEAGDALVRARFERLGFAVVVRAAREIGARDVEDKSLIAVSPTTRAKDVLEASGELRNRFRRLETPVVAWEPRLLYDLGMIPGQDNKVDWAAATKQTSLRMVETAHPLAAGLSGTVQVARSPQSFSWGRAREDALRIAVVEGRPHQAAVFAYDRGAAMPGLAAPARRVGFFLFEETAADLTEDGWALFDAAVRWCASDAGRP